MFEWVRAQRLFHDHATAEWDEKAGLYLTGRASAKEFIEGVRHRVGDVWRPYLELHVLRLFFRAKKNGLPDTYQKVQHYVLRLRKSFTFSAEMGWSSTYSLSKPSFLNARLGPVTLRGPWAPFGPYSTGPGKTHRRFNPPALRCLASEDLPRT